MTETKTYPYLKYIPHFVILRVIVVGPFAFAWYVSNFISESLEKITDKLNDMIPVPYIQKWVEFDKLPHSRQKEIERIAKARDTTKERILIQTVKP